MGCGKEIAPGTSRTPGWKIKNKDEFNNLYLHKKTNHRFLSSSIY